MGEGGGGGWGLGLGLVWASSSGYFAAVPKAPWPINRLFEFPPWRACHVSIRQGLFLLPVRLLAAGGSHTSQLAVHCCLVPGRLSCLCVCMCMSTGVRVRVCALRISCLLATHFVEVNVNANRVRTVLVPVKDDCSSLKTSDFFYFDRLILLIALNRV